MAECPDIYKNKFLSLLKDGLIFLKYGQIYKSSDKEEKNSTKIFIDFYPNISSKNNIGFLDKKPIYSTYSDRYLDKSYVGYILLDELYDINNVNSFSSLIDKSITYFAFHAKQQIEEDIMNKLLQKENSNFPSGSLKEKIISGKNELIKNKVPPFQDGYYVCFIHPRKLEELIAYQYSSLLPVEEEGKKIYVDCFGIKYIPTQIPSLIKHSDNKDNKDNKEVYQTIIIGTDAYGIVDLDENDVNITCKNADQKTNIGYELNLRMRLLNPQAIIKIESD
jgi:hypothetical protein